VIGKVADNQVLVVESNNTPSITKRGNVRKGFTILDSAPKKIRTYIIDMWNRGYSRTGIINLLKNDYNIEISNDSLKNWLDKQDEFKFNPGSESSSELAQKEISNVLDGIYDVQKKLREKFDRAIEEDNTDKIATYAKLIGDNVSVAHRILSDTVRNTKANENNNSGTESFAQVLERLRKKS